MHWTSPQHQPSHEQAEHCDRPGFSTGSKQMLQRPVPRRCLRFEMDRERRFKGLKTEETTILHCCGVGFVAEHHIFSTSVAARGPKLGTCCFWSYLLASIVAKLPKPWYIHNFQNHFREKLARKTCRMLHELSGRHLNPLCLWIVLKDPVWWIESVLFNSTTPLSFDENSSNS